MRLFLICFLVVFSLLVADPCKAQSVAWSEVDIAKQGPTGSFSYSSGSPPTYTVAAAGQGSINGFNFDQIGFAQVATCGNTELTAQIYSQSSTNSGAQAGIAVRDSLDQHGVMVAMYVTPSGALNFSYRQRDQGLNVVAGPTSGGPFYTRLAVRSGTVYGFYSTDGQNWTPLGSFAVPNGLPNVYNIGFWSANGDNAALNTAVFKYVTYATSVPQQASNLLLWLRADSGVTASGGAISAWSDQSGNGANTTQTTSAAQPTLSNGALSNGVLPVVNFNGTSQYFSLPSGFSSLGNGASIFVVIKPASTSATGTALACGNSSNSDALLAQTVGTQASLKAYNGTTSSAVTTTTNPLSTSAYKLLEMTLQPGATSGTATGTIFVNGAQIIQATNLQNLNSISRTQNFVGVASGSTNYFQGSVAEILCYSASVPAYQRKSLESYFLSKYGIGATPTLDPPAFVPQSGIYTNNQAVTFAQDQLAEIWYRLDGVTPVPGAIGTLWAAPTLTLRQGVTNIQAIASAPFFNNSSVASATYQTEVDTAPIPRNGLALWLNPANGLTSSGGKVSSWSDSSGSGNTATQSTSSKQPGLVTNAINGLSAVSFNGTSQYLQLPAGLSDLTAGVSIFAVVKPTAVTAGARILDFGNGATSDNVQLQEPASGNAALYLYNGSTASSLTATSALTLNQFQLLETLSGGGSANIYKNSTLLAQSSSVNNLNNIARTNNFIGQGSASGNYFQGQIAELLFYSRQLTGDERAAVEGYLLNRYQSFAGNTIPLPLFNISTSTLSAPGQVAISAPAEAQIKYTTDGTTPTISGSPTYSGPIYVYKTTTIKAISVVDGVGSSVVSNTYTLNSTQWPAPSTSSTPLQINLQLPRTSIPQDSNQH